jgi:hypothetical protein
VTGGRLIAVVTLGLAAVVLAGCGGARSAAPAGSASPLPAVVVDSPTAFGWVRLIRAAGYAVRTGSVHDLMRRTAGIVPADAALSQRDLERIAGWVRGGGRLATPDAALLRSLGVRLGSPRSVGAAHMEGLPGMATWASPLAVRPLAGEGMRALATSLPGGAPLVGAVAAGKGEVLAFAADPVDAEHAGFELFPEDATLVGRELRMPLGPTARDAEIYVDPGGLPPSLAHDPKKIAALLARGGARIAQIAAWNYDFNDPAANYDYARMIDALHARGILAYAWLEPPFVTLRLWQDHPECREKTETGRDAHVDWRRLIALEDPRCFRLATQSWTHVLDPYRWDGVNVAELYFEPRTLVRNYTPFSRAALAAFGHDPRKDPGGFVAFRERLVTQLNRRVLHFVTTRPGSSSRGFELTVIDDTLDPALGQGVGSDVAALASVARHAGATLVVEDPHSAWSEGPLRYVRLGRHVASLMPPSDALLDVNVVPRYGGPRPTVQMTGAELQLALSAATASLGRLGVYSLGTLPARDLVRIPGAMAAGTATTDLGVYGRWMVQVTAPSPGDRRLEVDGIPWPAANGTALVPPGNHVLTWSGGNPRGPGLESFTGELGTARVSSGRIDFSYDARPAGLAVVTAKPSALAVDGKTARLDVWPASGGGWVVRVPAGTHKAELRF